MRFLLRTTPIAFLAVVFPFAALANISGTIILSANQLFSLDTGTVVTSGGDFLWTGSSITPQAGATAHNIGALGQTYFGVLTQSILSSLSPYSVAALPGSSLVSNDIFTVKTNGGNYSAVLVTAVGGGSATLQYLTFEAAVVPSGPAISQVLNNYGLVPVGFSNSGIAQGSLFIIKGSGLANTNTAVFQSSASPGLPTGMNGASVKVTVGTTTTVPVFYYATASQLALVLPSATPLGAAQVTVTYNGQTTAPFAFQVVASAMGFDAFYGTGSGLGVAQNPANGIVYTYANAIPPNTSVALWGSGLGADPVRDSVFVAASPATTINSLAHVYVGGVDAPILYQGASGYPGVSLVDITIPANVPTGCNVSLVGVSTTGVSTNFTTLPIGNGGACSDLAFGNSGATISTLSGHTTVNTGLVLLDQATAPVASGGTQLSNIALAAFQSQPGSTYGSATGTVSIGGCIVQQNLISTATTSTPAGLNAGTITVTGPAGTATLIPVGSSLPGYYEAQLASGFIPTAGGSFAFNGTAGVGVGAFNGAINYSTPLLTWTNQSADATITRSAGVPVTWSGGSTGTFVVIAGSSSSGVASGSFSCYQPVSSGQFTVPPYVLNAMPAGSGSLSVSNYSNYTTFTATGIDYGFAAGFVTYDINSTWQ